jgi:S-DNA-T family DNA segregation ATPase FtsK/SpoIIIE
LVTIALADDTLAPVGVEPRGLMLIGGPPFSGRTTALLTMATAIRRATKLKPVLFAPRRSPLEQALDWAEVARGDEEANALADRLTAELAADDAIPGQYALFIDAVPDFSGGGAEAALVQLIKVALRSEQFIVGEGEASSWANAWNLGKVFKAGRRGLVLVPGQMDTDNLTGVSVGRFKAGDFPPGRGFLVANGRFRKVQVALS